MQALAMTENPYASPLARPPASTPTSADRPPSRPLSVSVVSVFLGVTGFYWLVALAMAIVAVHDAIQQGKLVFQGLLMVGLGAIAAMMVGELTAGVAMWFRQKWGWWLGAFCYVYGFMRHGAEIGFTVLDFAEYQAEGARPDRMIVKSGVRMLVAGVILLYIFKDNFLDYFDLYRLHRGVALLVLAAVSVVFIVAANLYLYWSPEIEQYLFGGG